MPCLLREATRDDVLSMHRVRLSVTENRLTSVPLHPADYVAAIEQTGRGWVIDCQGEIVAFAVGDATSGSVWALFVHPDHERRGHGRRLHDTMIEWLFAGRLDCVRLTTEPGTRAERFYRAAGWQSDGLTERGELMMVNVRPAD
jgi:GNAT superfamily N-acetyltransferase